MSRKKSERIERKLQAKADKKRLKKEKKKLSQAKGKEDKKRSLSDILNTVNLATTVAKAALGSFFGHLRIDVARLRIRVATSDAASTAIAYGAVSQTVAYLLEFLRTSKRVKGLHKADIDIACDFLGDTSSADIKISFSLRVWHLLHIAISALIKLIKHRFNAMKTEAKTENKNSI